MITSWTLQQNTKERRVEYVQMINIGTSKLYPWGWRLSLGLCMVPATTLLLGGIFLDDTPNSLCERGHPEKVFHSPVSRMPIFFASISSLAMPICALECSMTRECLGRTPDSSFEGCAEEMLGVRSLNAPG